MLQHSLQHAQQKERIAALCQPACDPTATTHLRLYASCGCWLISMPWTSMRAQRQPSTNHLCASLASMNASRRPCSKVRLGTGAGEGSAGLLGACVHIQKCYSVKAISVPAKQVEGFPVAVGSVGSCS